MDTTLIRLLNEIWHVDTTLIRLLDDREAYLHAVIDNFSPGVLCSSDHSGQLIEPATAIEHDKPQVLVDGGVENYNNAVDRLVYRAGKRPSLRQPLLRVPHFGPFSTGIYSERAVGWACSFLERAEGVRVDELLGGSQCLLRKRHRVQLIGHGEDGRRQTAESQHSQLKAHRRIFAHTFLKWQQVRRRALASRRKI